MERLKVIDHELLSDRSTYSYEIDLAHSILHIPTFSLECLPNYSFLEYLSGDHYDNTARAPRCPPEHKYKRAEPPVVDLASYQSLVCTWLSATSSFTVSTFESLLLETMIWQCMIMPAIARMLYESSSYLITINSRMKNGRSCVPWPALRLFLRCSTSRLVPFSGHHAKLKRNEFTWVHEDTSSQRIWTRSDVYWPPSHA
jgi:hypothetical protein